MEESENENTYYGDRDEEFSATEGVIVDQNGKKIVVGNKDEDDDNDKAYVPEGNERMMIRVMMVMADMKLL